MAAHLSAFSLWISCLPCLCDSVERSCGVSCFKDEDITEARELDSSITQRRYSSVLLMTDWLVGWRYLKGYRHRDIHTYTYTHTYTLPSASSPQFSLTALVSYCVCISVCVCVCVFPLSGPALDGADLLGKKRRRRGVEKPIKGKITFVSAGVSLRASHG